MSPVYGEEAFGGTVAMYAVALRTIPPPIVIVLVLVIPNARPLAAFVPSTSVPCATFVVMSRRTVGPAVARDRVSVPVFARASVPVPESVVPIVSEPV